MSYQGYSPSPSPLAPAPLLVGDQRFMRLDGLNAPMGLFKNALINGSFDHWQRGVTLAGPGIVADRWYTFGAGGTIATSRRALSIGELASSSRFCIQVNVTGQTDAVNHYASLSQRIEDVRSCAGRRMILRGKCRRISGAGSVRLNVAQIFGAGGSGPAYVYGTPFTPGASFTEFVSAFDVPSLSGKVIGPGSDHFLQVSLTLSDGTGLQSLGIEVADLEFREVIAGYGDQLPPFERVPSDVEFLRCQRYFQKSYDISTPPGGAPGNGGGTVNVSATSSGAILDSALPVPMRAAPTMTIYDGMGAAGKLSFYDGAWKGGGAPTVYIARTGRIFVQANIPGSFQINFDYVISAEL